jgi:hypothetical protein
MDASVSPQGQDRIAGTVGLGEAFVDGKAEIFADERQVDAVGVLLAVVQADMQRRGREGRFAAGGRLWWGGRVGGVLVHATVIDLSR